MYKYERGIVSKVSNEGESVGKLVISSNRLDCNGFGGWPQIGFGPAHLCALVTAGPRGSRPRFRASMGT